MLVWSVFGVQTQAVQFLYTPYESLLGPRGERWEGIVVQYYIINASGGK